MSGKLVLLLLVFSWVCVAEDEARIDDMIKILKDIVNQLQQALSKLANLLENIDNQIKHITNGIDVPKIHPEIVEQIEAIMKAAAMDENAADSCHKAEQEAVEKLHSTITNCITECTKLLDPFKSQIQQQVAKITTDSNEFIHGIFEGISKCLKNWNHERNLECLEGLLDHNTTKVNDFLEKIKKAIQDGQVLIAKLSKCVKEMAKDVKEAIIVQFEKCIDDIVK